MSNAKVKRSARKRRGKYRFLKCVDIDEEVEAFFKETFFEFVPDNPICASPEWKQDLDFCARWLRTLLEDSSEIEHSDDETGRVEEMASALNGQLTLLYDAWGIRRFLEEDGSPDRDHLDRVADRIVKVLMERAREYGLGLSSKMIDEHLFWHHLMVRLATRSLLARYHSQHHPLQDYAPSPSHYLELFCAQTGGTC
jgi:hypothetical protein